MSDGSRIPETRDEQRQVWRRLRETLRPHASGQQVIVGVLCFLLGITIVVQVRAQDSDSLDGATQQELVRLLDESDRHVADLEQENGDLDSTLATLEAGHEDEVAAQEAAQQRLEDLEIVAGTVPAYGRGIVVRIGAGDGTVRDRTLLGVVQELRNAGAEVIQVGDVRIVASSSFTTGADGSLQVDGTPITSPFEVRAIGDPSVMEPALKIPGGASDSVVADGATFTVTSEDEVAIEAIATVEEPEYSRVVK